MFVFLVLRHERREVVHFNVTEHPTARWTAQQMVEAFPWDPAPRYLLRDPDKTYGASFRGNSHHSGPAGSDGKFTPGNPRADAARWSKRTGTNQKHYKKHSIMKTSPNCRTLYEHMLLKK